MASISPELPTVGYSRRSLLDLGDLVLHAVIEATLEDVPLNHAQALVGVSSHRLRQPFVLATICQPLRQFMMSRGVFWSKICISDTPNFDLIEASVSRSRSAPLHLDIIQMNPVPLAQRDPYALRRLGAIVHHMGSRLVTLTMGFSGMDIFQFLETEHGSRCVISGGIPNLRLTAVQFATTIQPIYFVGPRTTHLDIYAHTIKPLGLVDLLKMCDGLKTLRLSYLSFDVSDEKIEVALETAERAASGKRDTHSLHHLHIDTPSDLESTLKIILSFFPLTIKTASSILIGPGPGPGVPPRVIDYAIIESHLDLTNMQCHNSRDVSLTVSTISYELKSADGRLRRQFILKLMPVKYHIASPGRATALGPLQRVVSLNLQLNQPRSILQWLDLWRKETFSELRSLVVHVVVDLTDDRPTNSIFESVEPKAQMVAAPRLEKVNFEWEVTGMVDGRAYSETDPMVHAFARLCRVVLGAFISTMAITVDARSTRELTLPPSLIKKAILSC